VVSRSEISARVKVRPLLFLRIAYRLPITGRSHRKSPAPLKTLLSKHVQAEGPRDSPIAISRDSSDSPATIYSERREIKRLQRYLRGSTWLHIAHDPLYCICRSSETTRFSPPFTTSIKPFFALGLLDGFALVLLSSRPLHSLLLCRAQDAVCRSGFHFECWPITIFSRIGGAVGRFTTCWSLVDDCLVLLQPFCT
jgi:hypothetical protein